MVRRAPRLGLASVVCSVLGFVLLTFNFFGMIDGFLTSNNHQIYLFPLFETIVLGQTEGSVYVHAGAIGPQEMVLVTFGAVLLLFGFMMLRKRPDIPPPEVMDEEEQRQHLEEVPIEVAKSEGSQNRVTRDIVKSVVGERSMPDDQAPPMPFGLRSSETQAAQEAAAENLLVVAAQMAEEGAAAGDSLVSVSGTAPSLSESAIVELEPPSPEPVIVEPDPPSPEPVIVEPDPPSPEPVIAEPDPPSPEPVIAEPEPVILKTKLVDDVRSSPTFDTGLPDLDELFREEMYEDDMTQSAYPELNDILDSLPDLDDL